MPRVRLLDTLLKHAERTACDASPRYGNVGFRHWLHAVVQDVVPAWCDAHLHTTAALRAEWVHYLVHSFGDAQRLDYGTGHEVSFVAWLVVHEHVAPAEDTRAHAAAVQGLFARYADGRGGTRMAATRAPQVPGRGAHPAAQVSPRAGGQPRRVGPGRLPVPALCVGQRAVDPCGARARTCCVD